jgi:hypothetical protein
MVMLILAEAVLEKTGGDSMGEVRDAMSRLRAHLSGPPGTTARGTATLASAAVAGADAGDGVASGGDD